MTRSLNSTLKDLPSHISWTQELRTILSQSSANSDENISEKRSAVVILIDRDDSGAPHRILLTKRTDRVETHKGQICFPGGFAEGADKTLLETALREAREEIGIHPESVEILGPLQPVFTRKQVIIFPWVATSSFSLTYTLNTSEVEKVLYLQVSQLIDSPASLELIVEGEVVWGVTAKILKDLRDHLIQILKKPSAFSR